MDKSEVHGSYVVGLLGAVIGGLVGTLPWILCYIFCNEMYSILTVFIPIAAFKGFEIMQGKIDKRLPIVIGVVSFLAITIATLLVIPYFLLIKLYGQSSIELLKALYAIPEIQEALLHDYLYALLFTAVCAGAIIMNIKKSIDAGDEKVRFTNPALAAPANEDIDAIKDVFKKKQAMSKEHTISKSELMTEIEDKESVLNFLVARGIVVRKKDQYYYSEENERHSFKRVAKILAITFGVTMLLVVVLVIFLIAVLV